MEKKSIGIGSVRWKSYNKKAEHPSDPRYPDGIDIDISYGKEVCKFPLPYPAEGCGMWKVFCKICGQASYLTAAGRPDDPRSLTVDCYKPAPLVIPQQPPLKNKE